MLVVKTLIWSISLGSGTSGGVLAPVFMIGAALGAAEGGLLPLVVASVSADALSVLLLKRSVLTEKIARRRLYLTREYTTDPLETFFVQEVMTPLATTPLPTHAAVGCSDDTLRVAANTLAQHDITHATVVDRAAPDTVVGEVTLRQLLHARRRDLHEDHHREVVLTVRTRRRPAA
ncbi:MAG TPA: chloride channel protein [Pseudonocardiaceae bacterium]